MKRWIWLLVGLCILTAKVEAGPRVIRTVLRDTTKAVAAAALDTIPVASPLTANAPNFNGFYVEGASAVAIYIMSPDSCIFCADSTITVDYSMDGVSWVAWSSSQVDGIDVFTGITAATNLKRSSIGSGKAIHILPSANSSATSALPWLTVKYIRLRVRVATHASFTNPMRYAGYIYDDGIFGMAGRYAGFSQVP